MANMKTLNHGLFQVLYPNGKAPELGTKLDANDIKELPSVSFTNEAGAKYVVVMFGKSQHALYYWVCFLKKRDKGIKY